MPVAEVKKDRSVAATENACKLCAPLGASVVFKGIARCLPFIHGSQGCATYMRRYLISHFREPMDIASSNFSESSTIFGGGSNLKTGLSNVISQYQPEVIGVSTSCLAETIGDNVEIILKEFIKEKAGEALPALVQVSTPSYQGTHMQGFYEAVFAVVKQLAERKEEKTLNQLNLFPGFLSTADLRELKEICEDFKIESILLPDYEKTLEGGVWEDYERLPEGGTTLAQIKSMGQSKASLEFSWTLGKNSAAKWLAGRFGVSGYQLGIPMGVKLTDAFLQALSTITGRDIPEKYEEQRGRLIDAYVDGHKELSGKKVAIYGEEDLVIGLTAFCSEIGLKPVVIASGAESGLLENKVKQFLKKPEDAKILSGVDFVEIEKAVLETSPDLVMGNSKGYSFTRRLGLPLLRLGFPIHDRIGGQRVLHISYDGAMRLYDQIVNLLLEKKQKCASVAYSYL